MFFFNAQPSGNLVDRLHGSSSHETTVSMIRFWTRGCAYFANDLSGVCHAPYRWLDVNVQGWLECVDETPVVPAKDGIQVRGCRLSFAANLR